jgi:hypothetical protein
LVTPIQETPEVTGLDEAAAIPVGIGEDGLAHITLANLRLALGIVASTPPTELDPDVIAGQIAALTAGLDALQAQQVASLRAFSLWSQLEALPVSGYNGTEGAIVFGDTGEHTDPVTGLTKPNRGVFIYRTGTPSGWEWIQGVPDDSIAAQIAADAAAVEAAKAVVLAAKDDVTANAAQVGDDKTAVEIARAAAVAAADSVIADSLALHTSLLATQTIVAAYHPFPG